MKGSFPKFVKLIAWSATAIGLVLVSGMFWSDLLNPFIFNAKGDYRTDGIFSTLSPILLSVSMSLHLGWLRGLPILFVCLAGLVFIYSRTSVKLTAFRSRPFTATALVLVVMAHAIVVAVSVPLFFVPAGERIRPMGLAAFVCLVSFTTFLLVVPVSIVACIKEKPRWLGIIGLIGACTTLPVSMFILRLAARIKGFELEE
jgi:hypothetical protein